MTGYLLLLAFGRRGTFGAALAELGIVFSFRWTGAALACAVMGFPLMVRAMRLSLEAVDARLEQAACFTQQTGEAHWHVLHRARAIETGSFMISAAQGGHHEDGRDTYGHSLIVDPWGKVLADAGGSEPGVILAEVDLSRVTDARARIPTLEHARPFTVERVGRSA